MSLEAARTGGPTLTRYRSPYKSLVVVDAERVEEGKKPDKVNHIIRFEGGEYATSDSAEIARLDKVEDCVRV